MKAEIIGKKEKRKRRNKMIFQYEHMVYVIYRVNTGIQCMEQSFLVLLP